MAEEFQTGVCGGNFWWNNMNSTRSVFPLMMTSSPCSMAANNDAGGIGYSSWQTDTVDLEATTTTTTTTSSSCAHQQDTNNDDTSLGFLDATTKPLMGFGLSSNWNHSLLGRCSGKPAQSNGFNNCMFQEGSGIDSSSNSPITQKDWSSKSFSSSISISSSSSCATMNDNGFKQLNHQHQDLYAYPSNSTVIQSLYDPPPHHHHIPQPQDSLFNNPSVAYSSTPNYGLSSNEASPTSWSKLGLLHFSNNNTTPFWNIASPQPQALHDMRAGVFASSSSSSSSQPQQQYKTCTPNFPTALITKPKSEEAPAELASVAKKSVGEPAIKKQRIETPSPLPTFKVRKEKLGDRITALQQLVSPFGKTDTASVLHEAIEYIRFLHDQVSVLSTPYLKNGASIQHHQQGCDMKDSEGPKQDLRSRGLCLVPISSTFPVTNETTADFWTSSFGDALIR